MLSCIHTELLLLRRRLCLYLLLRLLHICKIRLRCRIRLLRLGGWVVLHLLRRWLLLGLLLLHIK